MELKVFRYELQLPETTDWVKVFDARNSTLFVTHQEPPAVGTRVRIDLILGGGGESPKVILRGEVISRRTQGDMNLPVGFSIALAREDHEKVNYLNGFVRGGLLNLRERRRLPVRLPITYGGITGPIKSFTRDVNEEGLFIVTEDPLPEESETRMLIDFPNQPTPFSVAGVVVHTVVVEDEDVPGMGIRFQFEAGQTELFSKLVDELENRFIRGDLPDEILL